MSLRRTLRHIPLVLALLYLRTRYFPWLGAHAMVHPWLDLLLAYRHPAAYLDLQALHDAKFWFTYTVTLRAWNAVGRTCVAFNRTRGLNDGAESEDKEHGIRGLVLVSDTLATLHHVLALERNLFGLGFSLAILTAAAKVILYDEENLSRVGVFTVWYVLWNGVGIFNMFAGAALQQSKATFLQGLAVVGIEMAFLVALVVYQADALRALCWVFYPVTWSAMKIWRLWLHMYVPFLKLCGVAVFVGIVLQAVFWVDRTIRDPHNLEGSTRAVLEALNKIEGLGDDLEKLRVGEGRMGGGGAWAGAQVDDDTDQETESWDWPEDESTTDREGGDQASSTTQGADDTPSQTQATAPATESTAKIRLDEALVILEKAAAQEFESAFGQILRTVQDMEFASSASVMGRYRGRRVRGRYGYPGNNALRNDRFDAGLYQQRRGNGWHFGAQHPGMPLGSLSYNRTYTQDDPPPWFFWVLVVGTFALFLGMWLYNLYLWWKGDVELVLSEPEVAECWQIGIPVGPVLVGYGCEGFFWDVLPVGY